MRYARQTGLKINRQCRASDLTGGDRLEEKLFQQKSKDDLHETSKDL
jgi:hypothetical protein